MTSYFENSVNNEGRKTYLDTHRMLLGSEVLPHQPVHHTREPAPIPPPSVHALGRACFLAPVTAGVRVPHNAHRQRLGEVRSSTCGGKVLRRVRLGIVLIRLEILAVRVGRTDDRVSSSAVHAVVVLIGLAAALDRLCDVVVTDVADVGSPSAWAYICHRPPMMATACDPVDRNRVEGDLCIYRRKVGVSGGRRGETLTKDSSASRLFRSWQGRAIPTLSRVGW